MSPALAPPPYRAFVPLLLGFLVILAAACGAPGDAAPILGQSPAVSPTPRPGALPDPTPPPSVPVACPGGAEVRPPAPLSQPYATSGSYDSPTSFRVLDDGVASFGYPIFTPPGRAGMQPSLSLQYASNGGYGVAGMGFSIGGLSRIARCPKNRADHGLVAPPAFTEDDPICLDGTALVKIGGSGGVNEYVTVPDTQVRVRGYVSSAATSRFVVLTREGLIHYYGFTDESRVQGPGEAVASWALTQTADRYGNTINYTYDQPARTGLSGLPIRGEQILTGIDYTGHTSGLEPLFHIAFEYADVSASQVWRGYRYGREVVRDQQLSTISVRTGGVTLRQYLLGYAFGSPGSGRSRLETITECGADNVCGHPTKLVWSVGVPEWDVKDWTKGKTSDLTVPVTRENGKELFSVATVLADYDGDGRTDLMSSLTRRQGPEIGPDLASNVVLLNVVKPAAMVVLPFPAVQLFDRFVPVEVDGHPGTDLLGLRTNVGNYGLVRYEGNNQLGQYTLPFGAQTKSKWQTFLDLDGDRRLDRIVCAHPPGDEDGAPGWYYDLGNGLDGFGPGGDIPALDGVPCDAQLLVLDADGDGDSDVLVTAPNAPSFNGRLLTYGTEGIAAKASGFSAHFIKGAPLVLDVNGDGLHDILVQSLTGYQLWLNTGRGFVLGPSPAFPSDILDHARAVDLNGDGREDILFDDGKAPVWQFYVATSNYGWTLAQTAIPAPSRVLWVNQDAWEPQFGDFNGDGLQDALFWLTYSRKVEGGTEISLGAHIALHKPSVQSAYVARGLGPPDTLIAVRDGAHSQTAEPSISLEYALLADRSQYETTPSVYERATSCAANANCVVSGRHVVAAEHHATEATFSDGVQPKGVRTKYHRYADGRTDRLRGTWLGFARHEIIDPVTGERVTRWFDNDTYDAERKRFVRAGLLREDNRSIGGDAFSRKLTWVRKASAGGASYFSYTSALLQVDAEAGALRNTLTKRDVDDFGSETHVEVAIYGAGQSPAQVEMTTVDRTFANDVDAWLIARPTYEKLVESGVTHETELLDLDVAGQPTRVRSNPGDPLSLTAFITRDGFGNVVREKAQAPDGETRESCVGYDEHGQFPVSRANALGHLMLESHGLAGELRSITDANGRTARMAYDGFLRPIATERPDKVTSYWQIADYDVANGRTTQTMYTTGGEARQGYFDARGRPLLALRTGFNGQTVWSGMRLYDDLGRLRRVGNPGAQPSEILWDELTYDDRGRITKHVEASKATWKYAFAATTVGSETLFETISVDPKFYTTRSRRDVRDRVVSVQDAAGGVTQYGYIGPISSITDAAGNKTLRVMDERGRLVSVDDPDAGKRTYAFNAFGERVYMRDAKGQESEYRFDKLGRLTRKVDVDGVTRWTYDPSINVGALRGTQSPDGVEQAYTYDSLGRLSTTATSIDDESFLVQRAYDDATGRLRAIRYPDVPGFGSFAVEYGYDDYGHPRTAHSRAGTGGAGVEETKPLWWKQGEDWRGRTTAELFGNGTATGRSYHPATGELRYLFTWQASAIGDPRATWTPIQALEYRADLRGDLEMRRDLLSPNNGIKEQFGYDGLHRLTSVTLGNQSSQTYQYDAIGNLITKPDVGTLVYNGARPHAVTDVAGTAYHYDANGQLEQRGGEHFTYTPFNKVRAVSRSGDVDRFEYDALGTRVKRVTANEATIYVGGLYERRTTTFGQQHTYNVALGDHTLVITSGGTTRRHRYVHGDRNGSVDVVTDEGGTVRDRQSFDAFGQRRNVKWMSKDPPPKPDGNVHFGYTGHEDDPAGIVNTGGRLYDPRIGRFLQPDPLISSVFASQGLNRYSYVYNNPLTWTDPSGLQATGDPRPQPKEVTMPEVTIYGFRWETADGPVGAPDGRDPAAQGNAAEGTRSYALPDGGTRLDGTEEPVSPYHDRSVPLTYQLRPLSVSETRTQWSGTAYYNNAADLVNSVPKFSQWGWFIDVTLMDRLPEPPEFPSNQEEYTARQTYDNAYWGAGLVLFALGEAAPKVGAEALGTGARVISRSTKGGEGEFVYQLIDDAGDAVYYGISNNPLRRLGEHANDIPGPFRGMQIISGELPPAQAKALETSLIQQSLASGRPIYNSAPASISPFWPIQTPAAVPPNATLLNPKLYSW